ncbi:MAG: ROK family protein [bacterium]|nr:ROK family protein [bacterium]
MSKTSVVGVDLGGTTVTAGAISGDSIQNLCIRSVSAQAEKRVVLDEVFDAIAKVFDDSVVGIGFGVPSVVDLDTGVVFDVENIPAWHRVPLKAELEHHFGVPAYVNNDANAFAVGEHVFGKGRRYHNMVGLTLGTGLGAGIIIDGQLYCGRNCGAGEVGGIPYRGETVEAFCSGQFFPRECGMTGETVYNRARAGDSEAIGVFESYGRELANAIMIVTYAFDPEAIILGGSISSGFDLFQASMREQLKEFAYAHVIDRLVVEASDTENAAVLGAVALYVDATRRR